MAWIAGKTGRRVAGILLLLGLANLLLWGLAAAVFRGRPLLLGTAVLAYGFGLRHAVDADHIAAIDNVTRKLVRQGQRPAGVGLYFSLGHSTVVFALSAAVALGAAAVQARFGTLSDWGGVAGTLVSGMFLLAIALANLPALAALFAALRRVRAGEGWCEAALDPLLAQRGLLGRLFRGVFRMVAHERQMYLVGLLFGLGFDTATEVGLLGISAASASHGLPVCSIMLFPALFTAGMALVDTADSALMLGAYGWAERRPERKLFYNLTVTAISVAVAVGIGGAEMLGLVQNHYALSGGFWDAVGRLNGDAAFSALGYGIIGVFLLAWIVSVSAFRLRRG